MKWIEFVKSYSSKNNKTYSSSLKDAECKKQYHEQKNSNNSKPDKMDHPAAPSVDSEESFILSPPIVSESISSIVKKRKAKKVNNDNPFNQAGTLF
jgi:hypothetical protein